MFDQLSLYLAQPFVQYALIAGVLIALCAALLGVTLVLRRYSFIGDSLSHVAFCAMTVASVLHLLTDFALILPVTMLASVLLLGKGRRAKIKGDAALAMLSVGSLAVGYLIINRFSSSANISADVCGTLFGTTSILTLKPYDVWICVGMSILCILVFVFLYNRIFAVTFDETFAAATGTRVSLIQIGLALIIAAVISLSTHLVGSLLTSALIIFPALSVMRVFKSFRAVVVASAVVSVLCAAGGILASILLSTPVGSTIVAADILVFFGFCLAGRLVRGNT
ncbi:MAG: metal ABC transporter permease [Clostridia bacterium]|nr:metal ABC transporter permease [Clostridia bacterium]